MYMEFQKLKTLPLRFERHICKESFWLSGWRFSALCFLVCRRQTLTSTYTYAGLCPTTEVAFFQVREYFDNMDYITLLAAQSSSLNMKYFYKYLFWWNHIQIHTEPGLCLAGFCFLWYQPWKTWSFECKNVTFACGFTQEKSVCVIFPQITATERSEWETAMAISWNSKNRWTGLVVNGPSGRINGLMFLPVKS